jgi:hypothetical protein
LKVPCICAVLKAPLPLQLQSLPCASKVWKRVNALVTLPVPCRMTAAD